MSTAKIAPPTPPTPVSPVGPPSDTTRSASAQPARVSVRQPVSKAGFADAAWWPYSRDLTAELPALLDVLRAAGRDVTRATYQFTDWDAAPRRVQIAGRTVRLGGFATGEAHTVRLTDPWGRERLDVLVIAPDTDPATAQRAMAIAATSDNLRSARDILERAATS